MTDEIKAAAERYRSDDRFYYAMSGMNQFMIDQSILARACLDILDREAERSQPLSIEWLETLGIKSRESKYYLHSDLLDKADADIVTHTIGDHSTFNFRLHSGCVLTTRGQVLDLLRLLGKEVKP